MTAQIVGLCGYTGAGKTTAAKALERRGFVRVRFAAPLKDMLRALGLSAEAVDGAGRAQPNAILCGHTPRHALQTLGTEWGRQMIGADLWVNAWEQSALAALDYGSACGVVADDVRFANEAARIRKLGGIVVMIERPGVARTNNHVSEAIPFAPDLVVRNDGSETDLARKIGRIAP